MAVYIKRSSVLVTLIWLDSNKDGIQDSNEGGVENITITLYGENGDTLATDITDSMVDMSL